MQQGSTFDRGRVLFADDDPFYRDIAKATLGEAGFSVVEASGGRAALEKLDAQSCDLLVLDLAMPDMSGFDVLEQVRGARKNNELPILVITGHDDTDSVVRAFDLGATSFLVKPLNWLLFVHHVKFVLKSSRAQQELRNATRMAELMSQVKSRLVGTLVSEFQTPLRSAYGFSKLLDEEADGPIGSALYRTWISDLHGSLEKLSSTHAKMLNFGRFLADGIELTEELFHLDALLSAAIGVGREAAARRQITVTVDHLIPPQQQMRGDRVLLMQALRAILDNAVTFSPRGSAVSVRAQLRADGAFSLVIVDTSPGLNAQQIDSIMGTGQGAGSTSLDGFDQSNGLKLSRVFVEAHQGSMQLSSVAGEGLRVELTLPAQRMGVGSNESAQARLQALAQLFGTAAGRGALSAGQGGPLRSAARS